MHGIVPDKADARGARARAARAGRAAAAARAALPAPALRRAAPARRHRARAGDGARAHRLRRAGVRARRVDPGADHQPARGPAEPPRPHLSLHRARPVGRAPHLGPRGGDVSRQDRRDRRPAARSTRTPLHPYTRALLSAVPIPDPALEARREHTVLRGEVPEPPPAALGLRVPPPLPDRGRALQLRKFRRCGRSSPGTGPPAISLDRRIDRRPGSPSTSRQAKTKGAPDAGALAEGNSEEEVLMKQLVPAGARRSRRAHVSPFPHRPSRRATAASWSSRCPPSRRPTTATARRPSA